jgi:S-adenosylmethionine hydrolase
MITLTTDFGLKDTYVAEMKGAVLTINPKATIVDLSHGVNKFDVRVGAFMLASATPYFPEGTVHLAVIDPGVGTERRAIVVQTKRSFFVGPDNGVLMLAAKKEGVKQIHQLTNPKFMLPQVSSTFHGRDIFAPAAAYLDQGVQAKEFGPEITDVATPKFAVVEHGDDVLVGEVLNVDGFGNVITNISREEVSGFKEAQINLHYVSLRLPLAKTYAQAKSQEPTALIGSHGFLELAVNQGSFADKYRVNAGARIEVTFA